MEVLCRRCKDDTVEDLQFDAQQTGSTFADWIKSSGNATSARLVAAQGVAKRVKQFACGRKNTLSQWNPRGWIQLFLSYCVHIGSVSSSGN
jgi:hypothetical protein